MALGGGIANLGNLTVSNSTVTGRRRGSTAARCCSYNGAAALTVTDTTVSSNTASANGGGIYSYNGTATVTGSTLDSNTADLRDGGGATTATPASLTLTGTATVVQNAAAEKRRGGVANGSASLSSRASVTLTGDTFVNDDADNGNSGGIWNDGNASPDSARPCPSTTRTRGSGHGGSIYNAPDWNIIATTPAFVAKANTAEFGGGVYCNDGSDANPGLADFSKSTVSGNKAVQNWRRAEPQRG